jgi:hypothetical protein
MPLRAITLFSLILIIGSGYPTSRDHTWGIRMILDTSAGQVAEHPSRISESVLNGRMLSEVRHSPGRNAYGAGVRHR